METYNQTLKQNLQDIKFFLDHIEGRVAQGAYHVIYSIVEEAIQQNEELEKLISSDSVHTLLRFGVKSPSSSGVDDCEEECYYTDLHEYCVELRKAKRNSNS